jgi:anti-sigma B factor antagonist
MFELARHGAVNVIGGDGPLTIETAPGARKTFEQCFGKEQPRLVFHMQNIPLLDSAGLELLLEIRERCLRCGGALQLAAPTELCRDILQATDVAGQFAIFDDLVSAVGSYSQ